MIFLNKNQNDSSLEKKFFLAIYGIVFLSGLYSGMYCYRFGIIIDLKHHLQSALYNPSQYFKHLADKTDNKFDTVDIDFKFKNYIKLSNQRSRYVYSTDHFFKGKQWKSRENVYVKSEIKYKDKKYGVKAKLFGKNNDHFRHPYKWSFRVKTKDYIHEFNNGRFNLLQPNTRLFLTDVLCSEIMKRHGVLSLDYKPINLTINNKPEDIYYIEDFFSKYLIEKNSHRDSFIFTFNDIKHPSEKKLTQQQSTDIELLRFDLINNTEVILNEEKFNIFIAILFAAQTKHPVLTDNLHFFYNGVDSSVEPVIREVWFEHALSLNSESDFRTQLKSFLKGLVGYNRNLKIYLDDLASNDEKLNKLSNTIIAVAQDIKDITAENTWKTLQTAIYNRYPQAIYLCRNIENNTNEILKMSPVVSTEKDIITDEYKILGDLILNEDLVLNKTDLIISEGVTVDLNGFDIILNSGTIQAVSVKDRPIYLLNNNKNGHSSLIIKNTNHTSHLNHVVFKNLSNYNNKYWHLPSAITFYEADVVIENSVFEMNVEGDDFINFFRCNSFKLDNVRFIDVKADAIDSDFSNGIITNSTFINIGNDAIDGSGSTIDIVHCVFDGVEDKVISAGEKSNFSISNSAIKNSEIAFVSKDASNLSEFNNSLENITLEYCVFNKKEEFLYGKLFSDKDISQFKYLVEKRSEVYKNKEKLLNLKMVDSVKESLYGIEYGKKSIRK